MPAERDSTARLRGLQQLIADHDHHSHVRGTPLVSDAEYDALFRELLELEEAHPEAVGPDSPSRRVGGALLEGFDRVAHAVPMLSIESLFGEEEVGEFLARICRGLGTEDLPAMASRNMTGCRRAWSTRTGPSCSGFRAATAPTART